MANKKKNEIADLRTEVQALTEAVWSLRDHVSVQSAGAAAARSANGTAIATDLAEALADGDGAGNGRGTIVTRGVFHDATGDREYRWDLEIPALSLFAIDDELVARMLAAIGHRQRLAILKALLDQPCSASDLVTSLSLGTTGAAYHHLNVLQAADLVMQEERGQFSVQPHRVSAVLAFLAGVASATDTTWSSRDAESDEDSDDDRDDGDDSGKRKKKRRKAA